MHAVVTEFALLAIAFASEALSARVIAGGEGGDPRLRGEGEVGCGVCKQKHPAPTKHHLTLPLLRNGPHPLPRYAAERDSERDVESNSEDGGGITYVRIQYFGICSRAQLFGSHGWKHSTLPLRSQTWQRPSPALFRILFGGTTAKPLGPGLMRARHQPSSPK